MKINHKNIKIWINIIHEWNGTPKIYNYVRKYK